MIPTFFNSSFPTAAEAEASSSASVSASGEEHLEFEDVFMRDFDHNSRALYERLYKRKDI